MAIKDIGFTVSISVTYYLLAVPFRGMRELSLVSPDKTCNLQKKQNKAKPKRQQIKMLFETQL